MHFRSILSGTLALLLAIRRGRSGEQYRATCRQRMLASICPSIGLPGIFGDRREAGSAADRAAVGRPPLTALEEQMRQLNGTIEELNFQVLQMQEQMRKMQEDNEFRFQELEKEHRARQPAGQKKSDAAADDRQHAGRRRHRRPADAAAAPAGGQSIEDVIVESPTGDPGTLVTGTPPKTFGTITFDENGNVIDADGNTQATAPAQTARPQRAPGRNASPASPTAQCVAALPGDRRPGRTLPQFLPVHPLGRLRHRRTGLPRPHHPLSQATPRRPTRISGWARRCSASRSTAMRRRLSLPPARTIQSPRRRPTCC